MTLHTDRNEFFIPDLCRVRAVFMLVMTSQLLVLLLAIVQSSEGWLDWNYVGLLSLFVQWTVLTSAALICLLRRWLQRLSIPMATLAVTSLVVLDVLLFSIVTERLLNPGYAGLQQLPWQSIGRNLLAAFIVTMVVLRYFYLQHQWQRQKQAEMQSRVTALQARIQPHFLFNSMNTIASLISTRPDQAEDAVLDLSELFRASLRTQDRLIPLAEELALCRRYLAIESLRLGPRLTVEWALGEGLDTQAIPPLTLQPLLENAIYHGIQPRPEGGTIRIEAYRQRDTVTLMIDNPEPEPDQPSHDGNRMAMTNIRDRLSALFDDQALLKTSHHQGRYIVTLRLPWHPLPGTTKTRDPA